MNTGEYDDDRDVLVGVDDDYYEIIGIYLCYSGDGLKYFSISLLLQVPVSVAFSVL